MQYTDFRGHRVESCFDCGGLWLDRGETEALLQMENLPYSLLNPPARSAESILLRRGERACSHCQRELAVVDIEGVQAEGCACCGGLWLEKGELGDLKSKIL